MFLLKPLYTPLLAFPRACSGGPRLLQRRKKYGYELGGPAKPAKQAASLFVGLWLTYVIGSIIIEYA